MNLTDAGVLAKDLIREHVPGWSFDFDNHKTTYGRCHHGPRKITLSRPLTLLRTEEEVRDTVLHEIAHALAPPVRTVTRSRGRTRVRSVAHGRPWKVQAVALGARPQACNVKEDAHVQGAWVGTCPGCGDTVRRHRLTKAARSRQACLACCRRYNRGLFDPRFKFTWHRDKVLNVASVAAQRARSER
jgi:hypothetical protein